MQRAANSAAVVGYLSSAKERFTEKLDDANRPMNTMFTIHEDCSRRDVFEDIQ